MSAQDDVDAVRRLLADRSRYGDLSAMPLVDAVQHALNVDHYAGIKSGYDHTERILKGREPFADRYVVRIGWAANPEPLFRMRCYGVDSNVKYVDVEQSAETLRVRARELVCRGLGVALVDCPPNVDVYYDQAAVQRLTKGASS